MRSIDWQHRFSENIPNLDVPDARALGRAKVSTDMALRDLNSAYVVADMTAAVAEMDNVVVELEHIITDFGSSFKTIDGHLDETTSLLSGIMAVIGAICIPTQLHAEVQVWCDETAIGEYESWQYNNLRILWLKNEIDRVQFKLRWGSEIEIDFTP